jgi:6,7-dimethyl-8-ribityllumazine synthase
MELREIEADREGAGLKIGVVVAAFNGFITEPLAKAALDRLESLGVDSIELVHVAGALEIAAVSAALASQVDAIVAIGAVIEGETDHYAHVAAESAAGLTRVALDSGIPVSNAVLTVRDVGHAQDRSLPGPSNKGYEAAEAAVIAANAIRHL